MKVRFTRLAQRELAEPRDWLNQQQSGLGHQLNDEVRQATQRIAFMPLMYAIDIGEIRKCVLTRFPYVLRYAVQGTSSW
jgi:plasmid stabilization system protein ParE